MRSTRFRSFLEGDHIAICCIACKKEVNFWMLPITSSCDITLRAKCEKCGAVELIRLAPSGWGWFEAPAYWKEEA